MAVGASVRVNCGSARYLLRVDCLFRSRRHGIREVIGDRGDYCLCVVLWNMVVYRAGSLVTLEPAHCRLQVG